MEEEMMLFLWEVEVNPLSEQKKWIREIGDAFGIEYLKYDLELGSIRSDNTLERSWFLTVYEQLRKTKDANKGSDITLGEIEGKSLKIVDITCRFSRYEGKKFLLFTFEVDDHDIKISNENLKNTYYKVKDYLRNKYNSQSNRYIIMTEYDTLVKVEKFKETIRLQNPIILLDKTYESYFANDNSWKKVNASNYTRYYKIEYIDKNNNSNSDSCKKEEVETQISNNTSIYKRELNVLYFIDMNNLKYDNYDQYDKHDKYNNNHEISIKRSSFFDIVHTEFLFFVRGHKYEKELEEAYQETNFFSEIINRLENNWIRIRSLFFVLPRFSIFDKNKGSRIFFYLLEISAQLNSLLMRIQFNMESKKMYYKDAFERLMFTVEKEGIKDEIEYFKWLHELVCQGFGTYLNKVNLLNNTAAILSNNIQQLRADFDSNTNITLQWLMFLLSIVLIIWGAFTILYDKWVLPLEIAINRPIRLIVGSLVGFLALILVLYLTLARVWIGRTLPIKKELRYCVKSLLNKKYSSDNSKSNISRSNNPAKPLDNLLQEYITLNNNEPFQNKVISSLEFFYLLITAVALDEMSPTKGFEYLDKISRV